MKLFARIFIAIFLGILVVLYWLPHDERFQNFMYHSLKNRFETMFSCCTSYLLNNINLITLSLHAKDIHVSSLDKGLWYWKAGFFNLDTYWPMILDRALGLQISVHDIEAFSVIKDGYLAISKHLKKMIMEAQDLPVCLKNLRLHNVHFNVIDIDRNNSAAISFSSESSFLTNRFRTTAFIVDGSYTWQGNKLLDHVSLRLNMDRPGQGKLEDIWMAVDGKYNWALGDVVRECYLSALLNKGQGELSIRHKTDDMRVDAQYIHQPFSFLTCTLAMKLKSCQKLLQTYLGSAPTGLANLSLQAHMRPDLNIDAQLQVHNLSWSLFTINKVDVTGTFKKNVLSFLSTIFFTHEQQASIYVNYDMHQQKGTWSMTNETILHPKDNWHIEPGNLCIQGSIKNNNTFEGNINAILSAQTLQKDLSIKASFIIQDNELYLEGDVDGIPWLLQLSLFPFSINRFEMKEDKLFLVKGLFDVSNQFTVELNFQCIKQWLKYFYGIDARGQGTVTGSIHKKGASSYVIDMLMKDANIHIPGTFNFIQQIRGKILIDLIKKRIKIKNLYIQLHKGFMYTKRGVIQWTDPMNPSWYVPLVLEEVFINKAKDIFCVISGALTFSCLGQASPGCTGILCIDEGQCKQANITSLLRTIYFGFNTGRFQQYDLPIECNVRLKTKKPFHFESPLMQADFMIDVFSKNRLSDPSVAGTVTLVSGKLHFPYRSLYITHGKIFFIPQQLDDPLIELVASGKIKKYHITIRVAGSAQNPHVYFESVPHLQDEQIITLLLSGSEEGSFVFAMPSVVLHNLQNRIFAREKSPARSKFDSYIKSFLEPFKHIRIVPSFVDQTGRGGFRGAIEINVSERLRAVIQKNFSLTEDTKLEVEYALSDDFTLRAIRDERGDLGGEVEMRWKF